LDSKSYAKILFKVTFRLKILCNLSLLKFQFEQSINEGGFSTDLNFYCLGHTFATHVLQKGADILGVKKIMGQSTPVVTAEFYDHRKAFDYWGIYGSALIGGL